MCSLFGTRTCSSLQLLPKMMVLHHDVSFEFLAVRPRIVLVLSPRNAHDFVQVASFPSFSVQLPPDRACQPHACVSHDDLTCCCLEVHVRLRPPTCIVSLPSGPLAHFLFHTMAASRCKNLRPGTGGVLVKLSFLAEVMKTSVFLLRMVIMLTISLWSTIRSGNKFEALFMHLLVHERLLVGLGSP